MLRFHSDRANSFPVAVDEFYTFSTISHTPQGQMPAQKPQPMHFDSSTTYSKDLFGSFFRVMAP